MALEFVAKHESFDDICDLDMTYNNSHLEVSTAGYCAWTGSTAAPYRVGQASARSTSGVQNWLVSANIFSCVRVRPSAMRCA
jgi:hypothetical protein